ncbi:UNVERIFIED_CONTAM: hypothetical protein GTU68_057147 [Idotea baltica]|nr:hypothetical protein [Idotea baltica]
MATKKLALLCNQTLSKNKFMVNSLPLKFNVQSNSISTICHNINSSHKNSILKRKQEIFGNLYFASRNIALSSRSYQQNWVSVTFVKPDGEKIKAKGKEGDTLLDIITNNNIEIFGFGSCEGTLSCSTCHLIFKNEDMNRLGDLQTDEECDMLDLAYGVTET